MVEHIIAYLGDALGTSLVLLLALLARIAASIAGVMNGEAPPYTAIVDAIIIASLAVILARVYLIHIRKHHHP